MSESTYFLGVRLFATLARFSGLGSIDTVCRVWIRYRKILNHLRVLRFDGVIDGGANIGEFALLVRYALPEADLLCVEPHLGCVNVLRKAGFKTRAAALWSHECKLKLYQPASALTSCTVIQQQSGAELDEVDGIRLDSLEIRGDRILVKLDLQGSELFALEGMTHLWPRCAAVLAEVSIGPEGNYEKIREELECRGFFEYSTCNELSVGGRTVEADKLWIRRDVLPRLSANGKAS